MAKLICLKLDDETTIYLETVGAIKKDSVYENAGAGDKVIDKTKEYLGKVLSTVKSFSTSIDDSIRNISDEAEVEFSVKLTADANIVICSASTEAIIAVKLKWKNHRG